MFITHFYSFEVDLCLKYTLFHPFNAKQAGLEVPHSRYKLGLSKNKYEVLIDAYTAEIESAEIVQR